MPGNFAPLVDESTINLPPEILVKICDYFDARDKLNFSLATKQLSDIAAESVLDKADIKSTSILNSYLNINSNISEEFLARIANNHNKIGLELENHLRVIQTTLAVSCSISEEHKLLILLGLHISATRKKIASFYFETLQRNSSITALQERKNLIEFMLQPWQLFVKKPGLFSCRESFNMICNFINDNYTLFNSDERKFISSNILIFLDSMINELKKYPGRDYLNIIEEQNFKIICKTLRDMDSVIILLNSENLATATEYYLWMISGAERLSVLVQHAIRESIPVTGCHFLANIATKLPFEDNDNKICAKKLIDRIWSIVKNNNSFCEGELITLIFSIYRHFYKKIPHIILREIISKKEYFGSLYFVKAATEFLDNHHDTVVDISKLELTEEEQNFLLGSPLMDLWLGARILVLVKDKISTQLLQQKLIAFKNLFYVPTKTSRSISLYLLDNISAIKDELKKDYARIYKNINEVFVLDYADSIYGYLRTLKLFDIIKDRLKKKQLQQFAKQFILKCGRATTNEGSNELKYYECGTLLYLQKYISDKELITFFTHFSVFYQYDDTKTKSQILHTFTELHFNYKRNIIKLLAAKIYPSYTYPAKIMAASQLRLTCHIADRIYDTLSVADREIITKFIKDNIGDYHFATIELDCIFFSTVKRHLAINEFKNFCFRVLKDMPSFEYEDEKALNFYKKLRLEMLPILSQPEILKFINNFIYREFSTILDNANEFKAIFRDCISKLDSKQLENFISMVLPGKRLCDLEMHMRFREKQLWIIGAIFPVLKQSNQHDILEQILFLPANYKCYQDKICILEHILIPHIELWHEHKCYVDNFVQLYIECLSENKDTPKSIVASILTVSGKISQEQLADCCDAIMKNYRASHHLHIFIRLYYLLGEDYRDDDRLLHPQLSSKLLHSFSNFTSTELDISTLKNCFQILHDKDQSWYDIFLIKFTSQLSKKILDNFKSPKSCILDKYALFLPLATPTLKKRCHFDKILGDNSLLRISDACLDDVDNQLKNLKI